jgi:hypothetical protein
MHKLQAAVARPAGSQAQQAAALSVSLSAVLLIWIDMYGAGRWPCTMLCNLHSAAEAASS